MRFTNSLILVYASFATYTVAASTVIATVSGMAGTSVIGANSAAATGSTGSTGSGSGPGTGVDTGSGTGSSTRPVTGSGTEGDTSTSPAGAGGTSPPPDWVRDSEDWSQGRLAQGWRGMHPHMPRGWTDWLGGGVAGKDRYAGQPHRRQGGGWQGIPAGGTYQGSAQGEGQGQGEDNEARSHHQRGSGGGKGYGAPAEGGRPKGQGQNYGGHSYHQRRGGGHSYSDYKVGNGNYGQSQSQGQAAEGRNARRDTVNSGPSWNNIVSDMTGRTPKRSILYGKEG